MALWLKIETPLMNILVHNHFSDSLAPSHPRYAIRFMRTSSFYRKTEDQIFFIFDHSALTCEEDDLKDAIIYFFPSSISVDSQCALAGQLMGMVEFFKSFSGSAPAIFTLQRNKIAIKHLGRYTLALSGNRGEPDGVVLTQLDYLHKLFVLYQGSLTIVGHKSNGQFTEQIHDIWDCYLPFVRRYGDNIAAAFESLPIVDLPETGSMLFLKASHLLQQCQKSHQALVGCLLYRNRVLCSQFHPELTARLLIIKPIQAHFPCQFVEIDTNTPPGVRLLIVYLSNDEKDFINGGRNKNRRPEAPPGGQKVPETPPRPPTDGASLQAKTDLQPERSKKRTGDLAHSRRFGSMDWNNTVKEFRTLTKDTLVLADKQVQGSIHDDCDNENQTGKEVNDRNDSQDKPSTPNRPKVHIMDPQEADDDNLTALGDVTIPKSPMQKSHSEPEINNVENSCVLGPNDDDMSPQKRTNAAAPGYGRQVSRECEESNVLCVEPVQGDITEPGTKTTTMPSGEQLHPAGSQSLLSAETNSNSSPTKRGRTISLLQNIKRITAQSRNILDDINKKMDLNSDMHDSDDEEEIISVLPQGEGHTHNPIQSPGEIISEDKQNYENSENTQLNESCEINTSTVTPITPEHSMHETEQSSPLNVLLTHSENVQCEKNDSDLTSSDTTIISSPDLSHNTDVSHDADGVCTQELQASEEEDFEHVTGNHGNPLSNTGQKEHIESSLQESSLQASIVKSDPSAVNNPVHSSVCDPANSALADGGDVESLSGSAKCQDVDPEGGLCPHELYIHGSRDIVLLLLLESGKLRDSELVNRMWNDLSPQLRELEVQLSQISTNDKETCPINYNYLAYNSYTKNLTGKISMQHGMLQPMSHHELDFCGTAVAMHQEFTEHPNLVDMTLSLRKVKHRLGSPQSETPPCAWTLGLATPYSKIKGST